MRHLEKYHLNCPYYSALCMGYYFLIWIGLSVDGLGNKIYSNLLTGICENLRPPTSRSLNDTEVRNWSGSLLGISSSHKTLVSFLEDLWSYCLSGFHMVGQFSLVRHGLPWRKEDCCISTSYEIHRDSANT